MEMNRFRLANLNARELGKTTALAALLICGAGWWSQPVRAEGSRELTRNTTTNTDLPGNRPYLEYRNSFFPNTNNQIQRRTVIKAYAEAGETINLGSSAVGIGGGKIDYRAPDGTSGSCLIGGGVGVIANRAQEVAGPLP